MTAVTAALADSADTAVRSTAARTALRSPGGVHAASAAMTATTTERIFVGMQRESGTGELDRAPAVRVDKWLWAARFYKSRSLAAAAIDGGKVEVNGGRVKPSREVRPGDMVKVRRGPYEHVVAVRVAAEHRGSAAAAAELYEETVDSRAAREKLAWQLKHAAPVIESGSGRPTKKDRRVLTRFKGH